MHTSKFPVLACAAAGIVGCFLPWTNSLVLGQPKMLNGLQYAEGYLTLICFILIAATAFLHSRRIAFSTRLHKLLVAVSMVATAGLYYKIVLLQSQAAKMLSMNVDMDRYVIYNPTTGIYVTAAAALAIAVCSLYKVASAYKPVIPKNSWFEAAPDAEVTGRFYLPS